MPPLFSKHEQTPDALGRELFEELRDRLPNSVDIAKALKLIKAGANLGTQDEDGNTGLIFAAQHGNVEIVAALLAHGAKIDHRNDSGYSALMQAAYGGYEDVARLLIEKGAELEFASIGGNTARSWAKEHGHETIVKMIDNALTASMRARIEAAQASPSPAQTPQPTVKWPKGFKL